MNFWNGGRSHEISRPLRRAIRLLGGRLPCLPDPPQNPLALPLPLRNGAGGADYESQDGIKPLVRVWRKAIAKQIKLIFQPKQQTVGELFYRKGLEAATTIGAGGARSGGKSGGLRRIMLDRRQQFPGTFGAIVRRTWPDLDRNHVQRYFLEFPEMRDYWHEGKKKFILPNRSEIHCMFAENQQEVDQKFWGPEFFDLMIDQAEQFSEKELVTMKTSNRWPGAGVGVCKTGHFFNPGGIGTEYLRRIYWQKKFHDNEQGQDFTFIHMFGWDNYVWFEPLGLTPHQVYGLPCGITEECPAGDAGAAPDYMCCRFHLFIHRTAEGRKLNALPKTLRAGHLLGSFDSFAGQYFAGVWDESKLILTASQEAKLIQPWWSRWVAHDDGFVHHAAMGWATVGKVQPKVFLDVFGVDIPMPVTVVVVYRDLAIQGMEQGALVRTARKMTSMEETKTLTRYFLSLDAWEKDSHGNSVAENIAKECRRTEKVRDNLVMTWPEPERADNNRIGGWRFMYAMMKKTCDVMDGKMNPTREDEDYEKEDSGYSLHTPLLFISGRCSEIIEAVPLAISDDKHIGRHEDVLKQPGSKADDVNDMVRYLLKSMLNPRKMPFPIEAAEKRVEMEQKGLSMTEVAIQMRKIETANRHYGHRRSRWAR